MIKCAYIYVYLIAAEKIITKTKELIKIINVLMLLELVAYWINCDDVV